MKKTHTKRIFRFRKRFCHKNEKSIFYHPKQIRIVWIFLSFFLLSNFTGSFPKDHEKKLLKSQTENKLAQSSKSTPELQSSKTFLEEDNILEISEIQKGMKGYGLSVFEGVTPERFEVEILGILQNETPKGNLILASFSGSILEKTGIIAGMSGSPVYIDEKLIGAVSHTFPWSKEPIGAIRPIREMLSILTSPKKILGEKKEKNQSNEPFHFVPLDTELKTELEMKLEGKHVKENIEGSLTIRVPQSSKEMQLIPVKTPILFGGIQERVLELLRPGMAKYSLYPLNYGVGGNLSIESSIDPKTVSKSLNPGDAVGIPLITGDMNATPIGTVTYRKGNKILIFGHPSFFRGPINMPMSKEYVHTVIPSRELSFKLTSTLFQVGRVFEDRNSGVAGELGKYARTIPLKVSVQSDSGLSEFSFQIVEDAFFFPNLMVAAIMQSVFNVESRVADTSIDFRFTISARNETTGKLNRVKTHDFLTGYETEKNLFQGLFRLTAPLETILFNPFTPTKIEQIQVHIDLKNGWQATQLLKVDLLKNKVRPGEELPILLTLKNYKKQEWYKKLSVRIPENLSSNTILLGVGNAKTENNIEKMMASSKFIPTNYDQMLEILNRNESFQDLVVWLDIPAQGLVLKGKEHPNLPSSILSVMKSSQPLEQELIQHRIKQYYRTNHLIYGTVILPVEIDLNSDSTHQKEEE